MMAESTAVSFHTQPAIALIISLDTSKGIETHFVSRGPRRLQVCPIYSKYCVILLGKYPNNTA